MKHEDIRSAICAAMLLNKLNTPKRVGLPLDGPDWRGVRTYLRKRQADRHEVDVLCGDKVYLVCLRADLTMWVREW
jgi:hypothetical protein